MGLRLSCGVLLLALATNAEAQTILCDPAGRSRIYPSCFMVQAALELEKMQLVREKGVAITAELEQARARFRAALPDKPDRPAAEAALVKALDAKDAWYFKMLSPGGQRFDMVVDGGLRDFTIPMWVAWVDERTEPAHQHYVLARNWIEFAGLDALGKDPEAYVRYVSAIARPWSPLLGSGRAPVEPDFLKRAAAYSDSLTTLFGQAAIVGAGKQLIAAPKDADGFMAPEGPRDVLGSGIILPQTAWTVFGQMIGRTSAKNAALAVLIWSGEATPASAPDSYRILVEKYGEPVVHAAAVAVNNAPRGEGAEVADPRAVGARRRRLASTFEDALASRAALKAASADMMDGADFQSWRKFPIGRAVLLADSRWRFENGRLVPAADADIGLRRYVLHSVDAEGVTVALTKQMLSRSGRANSLERAPVPYAARVPRNAPTANPGPSEVADDRGVESVQVNGAIYQARWSRVRAPERGGVAITTTWTSDEVPGGLLMRLKVHADQSIDGQVAQAFDVQDLSLSPARTSDTVAPTAMDLVVRAVTSERARNPAADALRARIEARVQSPVFEAQIASAAGAAPRPTASSAANGAARSPAAATPSAAPTRASAPAAIPIGSQLIVSTVDKIDVSGADSGRDFRAALEQPLVSNGRVLLASGTEIHLKAVNKGATAAAGTARISVSAAYVMLDGRRITLTTNELSRTLAARSHDAPITIGRGGIRIGGSTAARSTGISEIPAHTRFYFVVNGAIVEP